MNKSKAPPLAMAAIAYSLERMALTLKPGSPERAQKEAEARAAARFAALGTDHNYAQIDGGS